MSTYYSFKFGKIDKDGKIKVIGTKLEDKAYPFYERTASFIDADAVREYMTPLTEDMVSDYSKPKKLYDYTDPNTYDTEGVFLGYLRKDYETGEEEYVLNDAYYMPMDEVSMRAKGCGLVSGYATLKDAEYINKNGMDEAMYEYIEILSEKTMAASSQKIRDKYVHVSGVYTGSLSYICNIADEIFRASSIYLKDKESTYVIICEIG